MLGGERLSGTSLAHAQEMLAAGGEPRPRARARPRHDPDPKRGPTAPAHALSEGRRAKRGAPLTPQRRRAAGRATSSPREVVLVTGISGSGKSVALHALEDAGFFCVDNLPPELLRDFLRLEHERPDRRVAIAVDVRSAGSLPHLLPLLRSCAAKASASGVFLDASTDALVRRFSETRRAHPLADRGAAASRRSSSSASCSPSCARSRP